MICEEKTPGTEFLLVMTNQNPGVDQAGSGVEELVNIKK
jgi:hypothetical protein